MLKYRILKHLALFILVLNIFQSCNKNDLLNIQNNSLGKNLLNKWKESIIKSNVNNISNTQIDSIINIIDIQNYQSIKIDSSSIILYQIKNDNAIFGIKISDEKYTTLGIFKSKNRNKVDMLKDLNNIYYFNKLENGVQITRYNLSNSLESTYIGLDGNVLKETTMIPFTSKSTQNAKYKSLSLTCIDWYLVTYLGGVEISRVYVFTTCNNAAMDMPNDDKNGSPQGFFLHDPCDSSSINVKVVDSLFDNSDFLYLLSTFTNGNTNNENSFAVGSNSNGFTFSSVLHSTSNTTGTSPTNFNGIILDFHNHPDNTIISIGDIYNLYLSNKNNINFNTRIILNNNDIMSGVIITDIQKANSFFNTYPPDTTNGKDKMNLNSSIYTDFEKMWDTIDSAIGGNTELSKAYAIAYIFNNFDTGIHFLLKEPTDTKFSQIGIVYNNIDNNISTTKCN